MDKDKLITAIATTVAGAVIGWTGQALSINGRVAAIEASLVRIEARLYAQPTTKP